MLKTLKRYKIKPQHKLGQNFLCDESVLRREVAYADVGKLDTVLEIGPGPGNLTQKLLQSAGRVICVEADRQFAPCLKDLQRKHKHLEIIWGDALDVDFPPFDKVVANLPYKVSLPLIFKLLEQRFKKGVLIFQKRLAGRICAEVGEKGYCRLSVALGRRANVEILETLARDIFHPRPDVDSAIVKIERIKPRFDIPPEDFFKAILEGLFEFRDNSVLHAAQKSRCKDLSEQSLRGISGKILKKTVCRVPPREFGEIASICWASKMR